MFKIDTKNRTQSSNEQSSDSDILDSAVMTKIKGILEAIIAEQKETQVNARPKLSPDDLLTLHGADSEKERIDKVRFFLNAFGLSNISNLSKAMDLAQRIEFPAFIMLIGYSYLSDPDLNSITQDCYDRLIECIKFIHRQYPDDGELDAYNSLLGLAMVGLLNVENMELFAANPVAFNKALEILDKQIADSDIFDPAVTAKMKNIVEAIIAEQKATQISVKPKLSPEDLQKLDGDSIEDEIDQIRFYLNAFGLFNISNLSKAMDLAQRIEFPAFTMLIGSCYFSDRDLNSITQDCYDRLIECIKLIHRQYPDDGELDAYNGLLGLATVGLLNVENMELFAANPVAFNKALEVLDEQITDSDILDPAVTAEMKNILEAIIAKQKATQISVKPKLSPEDLQKLDGDSIEDEIEQIKFFLDASGLSNSSNLLKARGLAKDIELPVFTKLMGYCYFSDSDVNLMTQDCYDKLIDCVTLINREYQGQESLDAYNDLLFLAILGLLNVENMELFAANPAGFSKALKVLDKTKELEPGAAEAIKIIPAENIREPAEAKSSEVSEDIEKNKVTPEILGTSITRPTKNEDALLYRVAAVDGKTIQPLLKQETGATIETSTLHQSLEAIAPTPEAISKEQTLEFSLATDSKQNETNLVDLKALIEKLQAKTSEILVDCPDDSCWTVLKTPIKNDESEELKRLCQLFIAQSVITAAKTDAGIRNGDGYLAVSSAMRDSAMKLVWKAFGNEDAIKALSRKNMPALLRTYFQPATPIYPAAAEEIKIIPAENTREPEETIGSPIIKDTPPLDIKFADNPQALAENGKAIEAAETAEQNTTTAVQASEATLNDQHSQDIDEQYQTYQAKMQVLQAENDQLKMALSKIQEQLADKEKETIARLEEHFTDQIKRRELAHQTEVDQINAEKFELKSAITALESLNIDQAADLGTTNQELESLQEQFTSISQKLETTSRALEETTLAHSEVEEALLQLDDQLETSKRELQEKNTAFKDLQEKLETTNHALEAAKKAELRAESLDSELKTVQKDLETVRLEVTSSESRIRDLRSEKTQLQSQFEAIKANNETVRNQLVSTEQQLQSIAATEETWRQENQTLQIANATLTKHQNALVEKNDDLEEQIEKLVNQRDALASDLSKAQKATTIEEQKLVDANTAINALRAQTKRQLKQLGDQLETFRKRSAVLQSELSKTTNELFKVNEQRISKQSLISTQTTEFDNIKKVMSAELEATKLALQAADIDGQKAKTESEASEARSAEALAALQRQIENMLTKETGYKSEAESMRAAQAKLEAEVTRLKAEYAELSDKLVSERPQQNQSIQTDLNVQEKLEEENFAQVVAIQPVKQIDVPLSKADKVSGQRPVASIPVQTASMACMDSNDLSDRSKIHAPSTVTNGSQNTPSTPEENLDKNLGQKLLGKIKAQIKTLEKEHKGFFAANRGRKQQKITILNMLITTARLEPKAFAEAWEKYTQVHAEQYATALQGRMSARTRTILLEVNQKISEMNPNGPPSDQNITF